jgi:hypothetical protein
MSTITALGLTQYVNASSSPANVAFAPSITNTFRVVNTSPSATLFVGVYNDPTVAANIASPKSSGPYPGVVAIAPLWYETISGNFGVQNTNPIYVACVATGSIDAFITPVQI